MVEHVAVRDERTVSGDGLLTRLFGGNVLDNKGQAPLYYQLEQLVRNRIRDESLKPGDRLPTEKEFQAYFKVSRVTVRQALENLVRDGLISRRRGRGTEVNPPKIEVTLDGLEGFTEAMEKLGFRVRTQVLCQDDVPAVDEVAEALRVPPGTRVWHLERVRYVNDERIVHFHSYLPMSATPNNGSRVRGSLYQYLEERQMRPTGTEEFLEAVQADTTLAGRLGVPSGSPLLRRVRCSHLADDRRIEYTVGHYRGDRYRYRFQIRN